MDICNYSEVQFPKWLRLAPHNVRVLQNCIELQDMVVVFLSNMLSEKKPTSDTKH